VSEIVNAFTKRLPDLYCFKLWY